MVQHVVVMGVSGAGKSTIAQELATTLGYPFAEADDFHPAQNVAKMSVGDSLNSADREPWLESIRGWMSDREAAGESTVVACSALKKRYRDILRTGDGRVFFVHLGAEKATILDRMAQRTDHFMPVSLLESQFADLEPLAADELGEFFDVSDPVELLLPRVLAALSGMPDDPSSELSSADTGASQARP